MLQQFKEFTKESHLCPVTSKQPIELSLVEFEVLNKTLLHFITLIITHTNFDNQCSLESKTFITDIDLKPTSRILVH